MFSQPYLFNDHLIFNKKVCQLTQNTTILVDRGAKGEIFIFGFLEFQNLGCSNSMLMNDPISHISEETL